jgi:acyl-CoA thioesterase-2
MIVTTDAENAVAELVDLLTLREVGTAHISIAEAPETDMALGNSEAQVFVGRSERQPHGRVFGGQVLAQGVMAAGLTLDLPVGAPARPIHSLHAYFMRPGDDTQPIRFAVERMMDGRSFSTRRVHAIQHGRPILAMSASFQTEATGIEHQDAMPEAPDPRTLTELAVIVGRMLEESGIDDERARRQVERMSGRAILQYPTGPLVPQATGEGSPHLQMWMRAVADLPDDELVRAAILAFASDFAMLTPARVMHGITMLEPRLRIASLDHAMWFHRPASLGDWLLFDLHSPSAQGGRGLGLGNVFTEGGTLVASIAQEGMIRIKE